MEILLSLSVALFVGLMLSRIAKKLNLPAVTAYLVAGILVGPYLLGSLNIKGLGFNSMEQVESLSLLSDVALGFIAFSIGNEFRLSQLKKTGKQATVIGIFQAVVATLLVDAVLIGVHFLMPDKLPLPAAIVLGAVASATAPAATLMVVRQYKAKGPLTDIQPVFLSHQRFGHTVNIYRKLLRNRGVDHLKIKVSASLFNNRK